MSLHDITVFIHLASSSVFIGAISSALLVKIAAENDVSYDVAHTLGILIYLEKVLTGPAALALTLSGLVLIYQRGVDLLLSGWLQMILLMWIGSAAIARVFLVPGLQYLKNVASAEGPYVQKARRWNRISAALLTVQFAILGLAVFKPTM